MDNHTCNPVSILLVEDDDVDAMGIERGLKRLRLANPIYRAHDGIEGLEMLRGGEILRPYLILLDLNMPRMNGLEMLKELRNDQILTDSVVFALTTSSEDEDKIAAYREHVAGYIVKKNLHAGSQELFNLLDCYWRLIEFPIEKNNHS